MDLWIRSQDKGLYKIVGFKPPVCCNENEPQGKYAIIGICYEYRTIELGIYKSKERALEVLDEIQEILRPTLIFNRCKVDGETLKEMELPENAILLQSSNNAEITYNGDYVYEMPEE